MTSPIKSGAVHHLTITVTDVARSQAFYEEILGFQKVADFGPRAVMHNGGAMVVLAPPSDPAQAIAGDQFDENRVGLDHLSFSVESREELEKAAQLLDERGIERGDITDLGEAFAIYILAFRAPDNIQLELTAPYATD